MIRARALAGFSMSPPKPPECMSWAGPETSIWVYTRPRSPTHSAGRLPSKKLVSLMTTPSHARRAALSVSQVARPAELASDEAGKLPVIEHLVAHLERAGELIRHVVDLQPTSPLRESTDISDALAARPGAQLVVSVAQAADNPYFNLVERDSDGLVRLCKGGGTMRRQDAPAVYALNGSIYVWQRAALAHAAVHGLWSVEVAPYIMPRWKSVDIDTLEDFELAEWLYDRHFGASGVSGG